MAIANTGGLAFAKKSEAADLSEACAFMPASSVQVELADDFNNMFARYGNSNKHLDDWTGGDTTNSVPLQDGRNVWIFSDTFLGRVNPDYSRPSGSFINNSFVIQEGSKLVDTLHGGTPSKPTALVQTNDGHQMNDSPTVGSTWYWMGDGTIENNTLNVFVLKFGKYGPNMFDFQWLGTGIAVFSLPHLRLKKIVPIPSTNGVEYGSGLLEEGKYVYIYGTEDLGNEKYMHIARARRRNLLGLWEFFTGTGWSWDPADTKRVLLGVANEYSVTKIGGAYVLVTMDTRIPLSNEIVAYISCAPTGPWSGPQHLYNAPESGGNHFVYNAHAHPEFSKGRTLLVSYNVNSFRFQDLLEDVRIYRPRFIRVRLPEFTTA